MYNIYIYIYILDIYAYNEAPGASLFWAFKTCTQFCKFTISGVLKLSFFEAC